MKISFFRRALSLSLSLTVASTGTVFASTEMTDNGCRIYDVCGYAQGSKFSAVNKANNEKIGGSVNSQGCVVTTFRTDRLENGQNNILIDVTGPDGKEYPRKSETCVLKPAATPAPVPTPPPTPRPTATPTPKPTPPPTPRPTAVPTPPPTPRPTAVPTPPPTPRPTAEPTPPPTPVPTPPATPKPELDLQSVRTTADNQARFIANKVVRLFGGVENFRYNFKLGLVEGIELYGIFTGGYYNSQEYRSGFSQSQVEGRNRGHEAGYSQGLSNGSGQGGAVARTRFESIIDTTSAPDVTVPPKPVPEFGGLNPNPIDISTFESRLDNYNNEYRRYLNSLVWSDDGYAIEFNAWYGDYTLSRLYHGYSTSSLIRSYWRADEAFDMWTRHRPADMDRYWKKINDDDYANSREAVRLFISTFKATYDNVIDGKWYDVVRQPNSGARNYGRNIGVQVAKEYAYDLGRRDGYGAAFREASIPSYKTAYGEGFVAGFNQTVTYYNSNAVLGQADVTVANVNGGTHFVPGMPLVVKVNKLRNTGRQNARVSISLSADAVNPWPAREVEVKLSSTLKDVTVPGLGEVSSNAPANGAFTVRVNVQGTSYQQSLDVRWWNTVEALALNPKDDANETVKRLHSYSKSNVLLQLGKEWGEIGAKGGWDFGQGNGHQTLIRELSNVSGHLKNTGRSNQQIVELREEIRAIYGKQPSVVTGRKANWEAVQKLLNALN